MEIWERIVSNSALVYYGGDGMQIALFGCHFGALSNTLIGIGLSFVLSNCKSYPAALVIPQDENIYFTMAFLVAGLVWALCMLPSQSMQPTKVLRVVS
jgi:sodium/potassium/calcium exchanger 6